MSAEPSAAVTGDSFGHTAALQRVLVLFDQRTDISGVVSKEDTLAVIDAFYRNALDRPATARQQAYFLAQ